MDVLKHNLNPTYVLLHCKVEESNPSKFSAQTFPLSLNVLNYPKEWQHFEHKFVQDAVHLDPNVGECGDIVVDPGP
jgi:hypothetical protein